MKENCQQSFSSKCYIDPNLPKVIQGLQMNIYVYLLNKKLAQKIQHHIKKTMNCDQ